MDHHIPVRWGGRRGRYAKFNRAVERVIDPITALPVQFPQAWEYEAWLRQRFHPSTREISHEHALVRAYKGGHELAAVATFVVKKRSGDIVYHLVTARPATPSKVHSLQKVADATGAQVVLTTRMQLRSEVAVFWRMERVRQAAQIYAGQGAHFDVQLLDTIASGCNSRDALCQQLDRIDGQLVTARLAILHCEGSILIDFSRDDLGVHPRGELA